MAISPKT
jgi:hypothetical protein